MKCSATGHAIAIALAFLLPPLAPAGETSTASSGRAASASLANAYPARPVRWIVPFPTGGATDIIARLLADRMSQAWGQTVLIDNRAGAAGAIAWTDRGAESTVNGTVSQKRIAVHTTSAAMM